MRIFILLIFLLNLLYSLDLDKPTIYKNQNINGWLMSEKLDGVRAYWNGNELLTKNGKKIYAPKYLTKNFPNFELDGELWTKRADFENIQAIVLDKIPSSKWSEITYNIFESPNTKGDFRLRIKKAKNWFLKHPNPNVKIIKQKVCKSKKELNLFLEEIVKNKGEGVIIKNPNLPYINKRNSNSLKVKKFYDMEGKIIKINYKNSIMKSLKLKLENGITFNLGNGFSKYDRENPPKVGEIVTFKYYNTTKNGKPKFASFLRIRKEE